MIDVLSLTGDTGKLWLAQAVGKLKHIQTSAANNPPLLSILRAVRSHRRDKPRKCPYKASLADDGAALLVQVPDGSSVDTAFDALEELRKDVSVSLFKHLEGSHIATLEELGREMMAALGTADIPRGSQETLRQFVSGYCAGQIYTSEDVPQEMVKTVFIPLLFGALDIPKDMQEALAKVLPPDPRSEAPCFDSPQPLEITVEGEFPKPDKPFEPLPITPDSAEISRLERGQFFGTLPDDDNDPLQRYLASIAAAEEQRKVAWAETIAKWEADVIAWQAAADARAAAFKARYAAWEKARGDFATGQEMTKWEIDCERHGAAWAAARTHYWKNLGLLWESTVGEKGERTAMPRGINGFPMFISCKLMHKEDLTRVQVAIQRELEHRKTLEV